MPPGQNAPREHNLEFMIDILNLYIERIFHVVKYANVHLYLKFNLKLKLKSNFKLKTNFKLNQILNQKFSSELSFNFFNLNKKIDLN